MDSCKEGDMRNLIRGIFASCVTLCLLVGQAATTVSAATATEPPPRFWHSFTGNGGSTGETSRLYLFGGQGGTTGSPSLLGDFWYYRADTGTWTLAPTGRVKPGVRDGVGLSCGGGKCLLTNGRRMGGLKESWIYTEATSTWSQVNCIRFLCPPARSFAAAAYDPGRGQHLVFGGESADGWISYLDDTYTFAGGRWSARTGSPRPPARATAAATFVGGSVSKIVMYGGAYYALVQAASPYYRWEARCDMWAWDGSKWLSINMTNSGPCLAFPAMVWDAAKQRLVVASGETLVDGAEIPNHASWFFQFDGPATGHWSQASTSSFYSCAYTASPMALMAYDAPSARKVFFGGLENTAQGVKSYANTTVCD
jgi:hypothetical protein